MAFWALNALGKVKNFSSEATKKLKEYVSVPHETPQFKVKAQIQQSQKPQKRVPSENQLMQLQLKEYKNLVLLQQKVLKQYEERQLLKCEARQKQLEDFNRQLMQNQEKERKNREKNVLITALQSGQKSIQDIIQENIKIKEKLILSDKK